MVGDALLRQLDRWIAPLKKRVMTMIGKCVISAVDDSGDLQVLSLKFLTDESLSKIERVQEFGFTSNPPKNSEAIVSFIGGNQQHGVIIATDNSQYRLKSLPDGATAIYNKYGDYVKLTDSKIEVHGDEILIGDGANFKELVNKGFQEVFNNHVHRVATSGTPAAQTGVTSSPAIKAGAVGLRIPPSAPDPMVSNFNDDLTDAMLTTKTKAE